MSGGGGAGGGADVGGLDSAGGGVGVDTNSLCGRCGNFEQLGWVVRLYFRGVGEILTAGQDKV